MRPDREQQSPIGTAATQAFQHSHGRKRAAATAVPGGTSGVTKCAEFRSGVPANAIKADAPIPVRQIGFGKSSRPLENLPRFAWKIEFHLSQPPVRRLAQPRHGADHTSSYSLLMGDLLQKSNCRPFE